MKVTVRYSEGGEYIFFPNVYINAIVLNDGRTISQINLSPGKETASININCKSLPEDFMYVNFTGTDLKLRWIPRAITYTGEYRYSYGLETWIKVDFENNQNESLAA